MVRRMARKKFDNNPMTGLKSRNSLAKGTFRMRSWRWSECGACARSRKPLPGGFGPCLSDTTVGARGAR